jgi:hypothetical protein
MVIVIVIVFKSLTDCTVPVSLRIQSMQFTRHHDDEVNFAVASEISCEHLTL